MSNYVDFDAQQAPLVPSDFMDWEAVYAMEQWCQDHPVMPEPDEISILEFNTPMELEANTPLGQQLMEHRPGSEDLDAVAEQPAPFDFGQEIGLHESFDFGQWCRDQGLPLDCAVAHDATAQGR